MRRCTHGCNLLVSQVGRDVTRGHRCWMTVDGGGGWNSLLPTSTELLLTCMSTHCKKTLNIFTKARSSTLLCTFTEIFPKELPPRRKFLRAPQGRSYPTLHSAPKKGAFEFTQGSWVAIELSNYLPALSRDESRPSSMAFRSLLVSPLQLVPSSRAYSAPKSVWLVFKKRSLRSRNWMSRWCKFAKSS